MKIKFVIWTPNNEKSVNPEGWELPDDYYGVDDKRIIQTPYYFKDNNRNLNSKIWDLGQMTLMVIEILVII